MRNLNVIYFLLFFILCSCGPTGRHFKPLPEGPIKHQLIVLAKTKEGARARGFIGATPANTKIDCQIGSIKATGTSLADGSFSLDLKNADHEIDKGDLTFTVGDQVFRQPYAVKVLSQDHANKSHPSMLREIAKEAFLGDGKEIDSLDFYQDKAVILSSEASLLRFFAVDDHWIINNRPKSAVLLFDDNETGLGARTIKTLGKFLITPLFNAHEVMLIDGSVPKTIDAVRLTDRANRLQRFPVDPPLTVKHPIDADDSDKKTNTITKTTARNTEAVIALDDKHFLVSFANYYQWADFQRQQSSVVGPGIVALMAVENNKITPKAHLVMPFKNPGFFLKKDDRTVWVGCGGAWQANPDGIFSSENVGLVRLALSADFSSMKIEHQIALNDFALAQPAIVGNKLVLPHNFRNEIAVIDENASAILPKDRMTPQIKMSFFFTFATPWHGDTVFLGDAQGTLVAYSLSEGFFPFPFVEPIPIDKTVSPKVMINPVELRFRHHVKKYRLEDSYPSGYNAWVVSATYKIYPLDFLAIFGP
ncbi:MAG TPA: hypothetical protein VEL47_00135 [Myxococcota bacterium]|nr:hypothetical protein [Myxococcota bacterium]